MHPSWNKYPHLVAELDPNANKGLTQYGKPISVLELVAGTGKKLDWKCSTCDHKWSASGYARTAGNGCPICAQLNRGKTQRQKNLGRIGSMAVTHSKLAKEYQGDATQIIAGTNDILDWKCSTCDHEWRTSGSKRVCENTGCPACSNQALHIDGRNSMAVTHPELAAEYQGDATQVIAGTGKKLNWKCSTCEYEWSASGYSRGRAGITTGCPACSKLSRIETQRQNNLERIGSMAITHPKLAAEYQGDATQIVAGTNDILDWKCSTCKHEWRAGGNNRAFSNTGCPACANKALHIDGRNSMAVTHPKLAAEYQGDPTKIIAGTGKKLDWKCSTCEHEWKTTGSNRTVLNTGCPVCVAGDLHCDGRNSMAVTHPKLAAEYKGDATKSIAGTNKKLDWKCSTCEHEWKSTGSNRVRGWKTGCPACATFGFKPDEPAYYYVHEILNEWGETIMYKGGISGDWKTRLSVLRRGIPNDLTMELHEVIDFEIGQYARDLETTLLRMAAEEGWKAPPRKFDGGHELFLENPLDHARLKGLLKPTHHKESINSSDDKIIA